VEDTIVDGDKIVARCRVSGTHGGEGIGLAPTNKNVDFTGIAIVRVQDGKIVEAWNEFDFFKMYTQLGVMTLAQ
jgi:predicted ester cyclase